MIFQKCLGFVITLINEDPKYTRANEPGKIPIKVAKA